MLIGTLVLLSASTRALVPAPAGRAAAAAAPEFGDPLGLRDWRRAGVEPPRKAAALPSLIGMGTALTATGAASAAGAPSFAELEASVLDPRNFQPVCPASDSFYRFGQTLVVGTVGPESYKEYAPLIAGGLLRVRLELCVVESFFYEAIIPVIARARSNAVPMRHTSLSHTKDPSSRHPTLPTTTTTTAHAHAHERAPAACGTRSLPRPRSCVRARAAVAAAAPRSLSRKTA